MKRCIIAQSGGPTTVINASVAGVLMENKVKGYYNEILGGINGIEGILNENFVNLSLMTEEEINKFKHTPSSGLGSCRYKLKNPAESTEEYKKFFEILDKYQVDTFFYVGGNDSMDTVNKLSQYAKENSIDKRIIGIPKTIDNDLPITDHCPGYGSAARFIATTALETYLDSTVYINNGIFILETMGRDTGWLAASAALAKLDGKPVADFIYLPEVPFDEKKFIKDTQRVFKEKNHAYIVVSEGIKNFEGKYIAEMQPQGEHDSFAHAQLGGVAGYLKSLIVNAGITSRVKTLELGVMQRCCMHIASHIDIEEAAEAGKAALNYANEGHSGFMVAIKRKSNEPYSSKMFLIEASEVCNKTKYFPVNWINEDHNFVSKEAEDYIKPLIQGPNKDSGIPDYYRVKK